jgi:Na+-transporting NADH:ubiquinone oxidoreductase subunit B
MTAEHYPIPDHVSGDPGDWLLGVRTPRSDLPPNAMRHYLAACLATAALGIASTSYLHGARILAVAGICAAAALLVEVAFAKVRRKPLNGGGLIYGLVLAILLPSDVPLEMAALGAGIACLFGKEVFGGTGNQIFAPVLVGKAALVFGYPGRITGAGFASLPADAAPREMVALAAVCLIAVVLMGLARPANLRVLGAALVAAVCVAIPLNQMEMLRTAGIVELLLANSFLLSICLVACDPATTPRDDEAKWLYGLLLGSLATLMACFSNYEEAAMSAILVANLFAPTLDLLAKPRKQEAVA